MPRVRRVAADEAFRFAQVLSMCGLVFAQPVLAAFGDAPDVFLGAGATPGDIVAFAVAWTLLPAAALSGVAACTRLAGERIRSLVHVLLVAALAGTYLEHTVVADSSLPVWFATGGAIVGGALVGWGVRRADALRLFLAALVVAPVAFLALFLLASPVADVLRPGRSAVAADVPVGSPAPVVLVVFDELPTASLLDHDGRIDADLFPSFAALADDATWYRRHHTVATSTPAAMPAILTGRIPDEIGRAPIASEVGPSIFTLLGARYDVGAIESVTRVCPTDLCQRVPHGGGLRAMLRRSRDLWLDRFDRSGEALDNPFVISDDVLHGGRDTVVDQLVARLGSTEGPRLDVAHVLLPHQPWDLTPSGGRYDDAWDGIVFTAWVDDESARIARLRHVLQLQHTDAALGRVVDELRRLGTYDDTLVVVTADHGVGFTTGEPLRALAPGNIEEILFTPLLVKLPLQRDGRVDDRDAATVDIVPTIADVLDVEIPWSVDGRSLLGPVRPEPESRVLVHPSWDELQPDDGPFRHLDVRASFDALLGRTPVAPRVSGGSDAFRAFRSGPFAELVGGRVDALQEGPRSPRTARILEPDGTPGLAPVYVRVQVDAAEPVVIALAVNGRIAAVTHTHTGFRDPNAWFVLPEQLVTSEHDERSLYEVEERDGTVVLRRIDGAR